MWLTSKGRLGSNENDPGSIQARALSSSDLPAGKQGTHISTGWLTPAPQRPVPICGGWGVPGPRI